jgi:polar amino acid transport system substrate-binding protein
VSGCMGGWDARVLRAAGALALALATACADLPRDPEETLARVRSGTLRVGAVDAPPWIVRDGARASGPEAELIGAFARTLGARVAWQWGAHDDHMRALERYELDVVAAGLTQKTPWGAAVGLSRPWLRQDDRRHVLAVAPGENGFLTALDRFIEGRPAPQAVPSPAGEDAGGARVSAARPRQGVASKTWPEIERALRPDAMDPR